MERDAMIVAGFGFSTRASTTSLRGAFAAAGAPGVNALATASDKVAGLAGLGAELGLPVIGIDGPLPATPTQSPAALAARGTGSLAEGCALAAAGPGAVLLAPRAVSPDRLATCAIAKGPEGSATA
jgi:cobalt-precorrin 5A hydrolase